jgi:hypothetical protein
MDGKECEGYGCDLKDALARQSFGNRQKRNGQRTFRQRFKTGISRTRMYTLGAVPNGPVLLSVTFSL